MDSLRGGEYQEEETGEGESQVRERVRSEAWKTEEMGVKEDKGGGSLSQFMYC